MHSKILSVLELELSELPFVNNFNLYHNGDALPFANLFLSEKGATLRVNSGETCSHASSVNLGRYARY